jgi:LPS-assembly protein
VTLRTTVVPHGTTTRRGRALTGVAVAALVAAAGADAFAQTLTVPPVTRGDPTLTGLATSRQAPEGRMLVEADSLVYDIDGDTITADGGVVIYYGAYTLTAGSVTVDRARERVMAKGSVEIVDPAGNIVRGESVELTDDLRDGVVAAFELVTAQRTAFTAKSATRTDGDVTVFEDGVYLPCVDCDGVAGRKPVWQIRAQRIVHKQGEKTVTFENASFEFLGVPIAWVPKMTQPDPSVRRQSGLLMPTITYDNERGAGLITPWYQVLSPTMDVTVAPGVFTRQGLFADVEFRHRLDSGLYSIRASGIRQLDPGAYAGTSGDREWRGSIATEGDFRINERWNWGWDLAVATDPTYFDDYDRPEGGDDVVNDIFLTGVDLRNRWEGHLYGFFVEQEDSQDPDAPPQDVDLQEKQPYVHPVIDHSIYAPNAVMGGELSLTTNLTSLSRAKRDIYEFDSDDDGKYGPDDGEKVRLRGAAGNFSRASVDALWRRRIVDQLGQVYTPFVSFRGDVLFSSPDAADKVGLPSDEVGARVMPAVGLEYSWPILVQSSVGSSVIEPIAQVIVRPNETGVGDFSNEDAQSLVFDTTTLFDYDKFSGYDRVEGGGRLNYGLRYTGTFHRGVTLTGTVGQSIQLFGDNSFDDANPYDTGVGSGLADDASDYVASLSLDTTLGLLVNGFARFDRDDLEPNWLQAQVIGSAGRFTGAFTYAFIRGEPEIGVPEDRSEFQATANVQVTERWRLFGGTRYDLENDAFVRNALGLAYDDEAFSISLAYSQDKTQADGEPDDQTVFLRLGLRTLGEANTSTAADY